MVSLYTQHEKIMFHMAKHPEVKWWYAKDFMQPNLGDFFVGYEATARMSELVQDYPDMFEVRKDGRFRTVRFKFEDKEKFLPMFFRKEEMLSELLAHKCNKKRGFFSRLFK